eukprot:TRINITY_DN2074_c0_g2_i1.p1 TRINITY_DN2074_c0_g2~~TRINITY_DN2074_c0_g2_i1.p1  ORF type:complete len:196 (-),score=41.06 TRINITY_DN2074_c0_g2_i1:137-643(-)
MSHRSFSGRDALGMALLVCGAMLAFRGGGAPPAFSFAANGAHEVSTTITRPSMLAAQQPSMLTAVGQEDSKDVGGFAGAASAVYSTLTAGPGAALAIFGAVVLLGGGSSPRRRYRRVWRRKVNGNKNEGRDGWRKDKDPKLFGPEKPPYEAKKQYPWYVNKMYKVIRE